jgi:hypothetical protein
LLIANFEFVKFCLLPLPSAQKSPVVSASPFFNGPLFYYYRQVDFSFIFRPSPVYRRPLVPENSSVFAAPAFAATPRCCRTTVNPASRKSGRGGMSPWRFNIG